MYSFLADSNEHKKAKGGNKNVIATIGHNEYKDVLLKNKCLIHSMNRIQSKDHRIGTYEINKISLSYFDDKIYIQNTNMIRVNYKKNSYLNNYSEKLFVQHIVLIFSLIRTGFLSSILF